MTEADAMRERIDALEMRVMDHEQVIEDLHTALTAQWRQVEGLIRQIASLDNRLRDAAGASPMPPDVPPPHY